MPTNVVFVCNFIHYLVQPCLEACAISKNTWFHQGENEDAPGKIVCDN